MSKYNAVITLGTKRENLTEDNMTFEVTDEITMDVTANIEAYAIGSRLGIPASRVYLKFSCLGQSLVTPNAVSIDDDGNVVVSFGTN